MSDIVTSRIFTDGEKGITATKMNDIIGGSSIQTAFYSAKSTASTADAADTLLLLKAAGSYAQVPVSTFVTSVAGQLPSADSEIWSVRLRSYNSAGNPNFEIDQKLCGSSLALASSPASGFIDRWQVTQNGTMRVSMQRMSTNVDLPGTSFMITQGVLRVTLTTAQASLGAGNAIYYQQTVEGPSFRELADDVHSVSILARSSVANLKFGYWINNAAGTYSLSKLCTLGAANTWTLITLPNMPTWVTGGGWVVTPGNVGYIHGITLAGDSSSVLSTANDTWQANGRYGALGQDNFASKTIGSTFDLAFVQHEPGSPGSVCSTLMDKPFSQNLDTCLRYYQKTYSYSTVAGTATPIGVRSFIGPTQALAFGPAQFFKPMAKVPVVTLYNHSTGVSGSVQDGGAVNHASATASNISDSGFGNIAYTTATSAVLPVYAHYTVDTGW